MPDTSFPNVGYRVSPDGSVSGPTIRAAQHVGAAASVEFSTTGGVLGVIANATALGNGGGFGTVVWTIAGAGTYESPAVNFAALNDQQRLTALWALQPPAGDYALTVAPGTNTHRGPNDELEVLILELPTGAITAID